MMRALATPSYGIRTAVPLQHHVGPSSRRAMRPAIVAMAENKGSHDESLTDKAKRLYEEGKESVKDAAERTKEKVTGAAENVGDTAKEWKDEAKEKAENIGDTVKEKAESGAESVESGYEEASDSVKGAVDDAKERMSNLRKESESS